MDTREEIMRNRARASRLIGVANELLAMAHDLEKAVVSQEGQPVPISAARRSPSLRENPAEDHPLWGELARQAYADRRRRPKIFANEDLFGEPAWDILLDLFIAEKERRRVSVTSACIGSAVPSTKVSRSIILNSAQHEAAAGG
ncbi:MarR family transcriptional regulator [Novosphingobium aquimarinum]|uniref:MarR family transcriptional regulator n=1 Tax=Novosphingobium aquimarinum TaxID=2682494 RepID=UPI0012EB8061